MSSLWQLPLAVLTDSYKATHAFLYPEAKRMVAYGEFRVGYNKDKVDTRIVFYGIRYIIDHYVAVKWTEDDVHLAEQFFNVHATGKRFPFPTDLFLKFVRENDGHFPVKILALPEGTVIHPHVPVYVIIAENEYARLVTFLETILTMVWVRTRQRNWANMIPSD
ncbi:hypothetical protein HDV00_003845 [Rhizophlyctis rosea]|nr:hypothetical protein HDV00_003845 [Rhizophlyctis rosea]